MKDLLRSLREWAIVDIQKRLGSHQLDAHLSLAYACEKPPEPWELYRASKLYLMPSTQFYNNHPVEIQEALRPQLTWEMLRFHADKKFIFQKSITNEEGEAFGFHGRVQFYDPLSNRWSSVDVPSVFWFDDRDQLRESILETKEELCKKVECRLSYLREKARLDTNPKSLAEFENYKRFASGVFQENLKEFDKTRSLARRWLKKIDKTPDFGKSVFTLLRQAENEVRAAQDIGAVGESWVSETELFYEVRRMFAGIEVIQHGRPPWLGRQHLDIWIPEFSVGIEYHGAQHFGPVDVFGGEDGFRKVQERDRRKRVLCEKNDTHLIEVRYDEKIDYDSLSAKIKGFI